MFSVADDYKAPTNIIVLHYIKRDIEANFGRDVTYVLVTLTILMILRVIMVC